MKRRIAFTMSEALIALGIISVLAALSITAISNVRPDENIIMFRKAYSSTLKVVQSLLNDAGLYPFASVSDSGTTDYYNTLPDSIFGLGFADLSLTSSMKTRYPYLSSATTENKFSVSFMNKLNPIESTTSGDTTNFTTANGIYWEVVDNFTSTTPHAFVTVYLDGSDSASCYYSSTCPAPNRFTFYVSQSGTIDFKLGKSTSAAKDPIACSYARYSTITRHSAIPTSSAGNSCF